MFFGVVVSRFFKSEFNTLNSPVPLDDPCFEPKVIVFSCDNSPSTLTQNLFPRHHNCIYCKAFPLTPESCSEFNIIGMSRQLNAFEKFSTHMTIFRSCAFALWIISWIFARHVSIEPFF